MKVFHLTSRTQGVCRNALKNFFSSSSSKLPSQAAPSLITERHNKNSSSRSPSFQNKNAPMLSLYRRISPVGDPDISIVPVLDQWVREGRKVDQDSLNNIIKSLKKYNRFKHALEISEWMTDKRYIPPTKGDITSRLHLIYKVHGLQKAEEFYNNISQIFKGFQVDIALLNIYSLEKSIDKAETIMHKLRDTGLTTPLPYNILSRIYYSIKNYQKMDTLFHEMETKGIHRDKYSFALRLNFYAATRNTEGLNKTMEIMEAYPRVDMDCDTYIIATNAFLKVGLVEKGFELLKKVEKLAIGNKDKYKTLNTVLKMYAELGEKDEVYRIWNILKKETIYNTGYRNMIRSLLKFDDIEGAEVISKEWETRDLSYDFRVIDDLVDCYVKKGDLGKAKDVIKCGIEKGGTPTFRTWFCLMIGYFEGNRVLEGVEAMKNATRGFRVLQFEEGMKNKPVIVLEYLERGGNLEEVEGFMKSLEAEGVFSSIICGRLLDLIKNETSRC
ncbi:unnamed protein product [Lactuca virosa]|uniref:Pentacotripeptide-repeat region of PRORP domain-containing protein n=1 Tax=Lactuca virosa TaxID=75947 RepID=A0AAU9PE88_9ASTR|nr:unnamed protein product [Lactuca virosa]